MMKVTVLTAFSFLIILLLVFMLTFLHTKTTDIYKSGYEKASFHTALHLQATGYLPSKAWRDKHMYDDIQSSEELMEMSPEITFISKDPCITLGRNTRSE